MKIFIAGVDGYLGWPLAQHLTPEATKLPAGRFLSPDWCMRWARVSATPIASMEERLQAFRARFGGIEILGNRPARLCGGRKSLPCIFSRMRSCIWGSVLRLLIS